VDVLPVDRAAGDEAFPVRIPGRAQPTSVLNRAPQTPPSRVVGGTSLTLIITARRDVYPGIRGGDGTPPPQPTRRERAH
jgi:hypothetical protein